MTAREYFEVEEIEVKEKGTYKGVLRLVADHVIDSLEGCPKKVDGRFAVRRGIFKDLKGAPQEVTGDCSISRCPKLKSLEGAPKKVGGDFILKELPLSDLKHAPKSIGGDLWITKCEFKDVDDIIEQIIKNGINVKGMIDLEEFGSFGGNEFKELIKKHKIGKFKDFLDI